jgi:hypothetical protein
MTTVFVTQYALRGGIKEVELIETDGGMAVVKWEGALNGQWYFHGKGWHRTREAAVERAEEMRVAKIASLRKQIAKLEKLKFS